MPMIDVTVSESTIPTESEARTWVLIREAVDGGWGIAGHAFTNAAIAELVKKAQSGAPPEEPHKPVFWS